MTDIYYTPKDGYTEHRDPESTKEYTKIVSSENRESLQGRLAYLLRHSDSSELEMTENGWALIKDVFESLSEQSDSIHPRTINALMACSDKKRYEINGNMIRALYGHSRDVTINSNSTEASDIPSTLFHGTPERNVAAISKNGLQPQSRQSVHLTDDIDTAVKTGQRHAEDGEKTVIFTINAEALSNSHQICNPSGLTYTVPEVPPNYLE